MNERRRLKPLFSFAAFFALSDQAIKQIVHNAFVLGESRVVVPDFFRLTYLRNPGGAFSILSGLPPLWGRLFFICATLAALVFVLYLYRRHPSEGRWGTWGLFLIFGGGLGNLVDRLAYGEVIDYLLFYWGRYHWPAFNLADAGITLGACLVALDLFRHPAESSPLEKESG